VNEEEEEDDDDDEEGGRERKLAGKGGGHFFFFASDKSLREKGLTLGRILGLLTQLITLGLSKLIITFWADLIRNQ